MCVRERERSNVRESENEKVRDVCERERRSCE